MTREEEDEKAREKSAAYRTMMSLWAAQDFVKFISSLKGEAIKELTQMTDEQATGVNFGRIRGILKAVDKIERELDYVLNWKGETS